VPLSGYGDHFVSSLGSQMSMLSKALRILGLLTLVLWGATQDATILWPSDTPLVGIEDTIRPAYETPWNQTYFWIECNYLFSSLDPADWLEWARVGPSE
jgi:hypothetical protein